MNTVERHPWIAIALLILSLIALHACTIDYQSYFIDEVEELHFAQGDFWKSVFMPDSMPPLFTLTLRSWLTVSGEMLDARWLSACLGIASTAGIFFFVRSHSNSTVALIAGALFAFSPLQLYYAQLIRGYALMTCLSVFCVGFYLLAAKSANRRDYIAFTLFSVIGMYSHYYFAMIPIAIFVSWLCQRRWESFPQMMYCYIAMFFLTCPVLVFLVEDFRYQHNLRDPRPLTIPAVAYTYFSYFSGYALGPSQRELQHISSREAMRLGLPWLLAVAAVAIPLGIRGVISLRRRGLSAPILATLIVPLLLIGLAGFLGGITYNVRFVAWFAFPMSVLFGFAFLDEPDKRLPKWLAVCCVGMFCIFAVANVNRVFHWRYQFEDSRAVARFLLENCDASEPVFVVSDYMLQPIAHYLKQDDRLFELPEPGTRSKVIKDEEAVAASLRNFEVKASGKRSWLVYSRPFHGDPHGLLLKELARRGAIINCKFAGIDLYSIPIQP